MKSITKSSTQALMPLAVCFGMLSACGGGEALDTGAPGPGGVDIVVANPSPAPAPAPAGPEPAASTPGTSGGTGGDPSTPDPMAPPASAPVSTAPPAGSSPEIVMSRPTTQFVEDYDTVTSGSYTAINNVWNTRGIEPGWSQQVGASVIKPDGTVDIRLKWDFPLISDAREVLGFPEVVYGLPSSPGVPASPGSKLPMKVSDVTKLSTRHSRISGTVGGSGHLAYDLWFSGSAPTVLDGPHRKTEMLIPVLPINGYGVPNWPEAATVGREGQPATGRDPRGYQGRETIAGKVYDVYFFDNTMGYGTWQFIVFLPIDFAGMSALNLDWMPFLQYSIGKGWVDPADYLANVELGVENVFREGQGFGDLTVHDFRVDVN